MSRNRGSGTLMTKTIKKFDWKENSTNNNIKMETILNSFPLLTTVSAKSWIININFLSHINFRVFNISPLFLINTDTSWHN